MNKGLVMAGAAAVLGLAGTASATQSRINSVGGDIKKFTFLDERNIFHLPAELVKYGGWAGIQTADGNTGTLSSFGFHYNFTPTVVLAIYGTTGAIPGITVDSAATSGDDGIRIGGTAAGIRGIHQGSGTSNVGDGGVTHKGTVMLGLDLGSARLGFLLAGYGDKETTRDKDGENAENQGPLHLDLGVGLGVDTSIGALDFALDIGVGIPTDEKPDGDGVAEPKTEGKQIDVGLLFRGTFAFSGPHELVPYVDLDLAFADSLDLINDDAPVHSGIGFATTAGMDIRLNLEDGITVQPGFGIFGNVVTSSIDDGGDDAVETESVSQFGFFYNLAVDVKVWEWLDIRFGGRQHFYWDWTDGTEFDGDIVAGKTTSATVNHFISSGVGFNMPAGVSLDIDVNTGWWQNGPDFITGSGGNFGISAALSKDW